MLLIRLPVKYIFAFLNTTLMKSYTTLILLSFLFIACTPKAQTSTKTKANVIEKVNAASFKEKVAAGGVQLVDIRTKREFVSGHINGSINYDYYQRNTFMNKMNKLDKSKPVYIYCLTGSRSRSASQKLKNAGFTKVYDLSGGIRRWYQAGFKLVD
jgi:rhodanese-related sulfurtransferase